MEFKIYAKIILFAFVHCVLELDVQEQEFEQELFSKLNRIHHWKVVPEMNKRKPFLKINSCPDTY